jgi:hypothetical protein
MKKYKLFFLSSTGLGSKHKMRKPQKVAGCGILHEDQYIKVHTKGGLKLTIGFDELKIGDNSGKQLINLVDDEIERIEIKNMEPQSV